MKCTICNEDKLLTDFASIYDPMVCKECSPAPDEETCDRCGQLRNAFFFVSSENPNVCGHCRDELRSPTGVAAQDVTAAEVQPAPTDGNTCAECGKGNDHTARYCRDCNSPLAGSSSSASTMIGTLATPSASKSSTSIADADSSNQLSKPESASVKTSNDQDAEQIKKVFKWAL